MASEPLLITFLLTAILATSLLADWERRDSGQPSTLLLLLFLVSLPLTGIGLALALSGQAQGWLLVLGGGATIVAGLLIDRSAWLSPLLALLLAISIPLTVGSAVI